MSPRAVRMASWSPTGGAGGMAKLGSTEPVSPRTRHARELFAGLPSNYDSMAGVLSFWQDPRWRRVMVSRGQVPAGARGLGVATGPGAVGVGGAAENGARGSGGGLSGGM